MPRPLQGRVIARDGKRGTTFALRFYAYGKRRYVTLGSSANGWTIARAEEELSNVIADVRRGLWRPPEPPPVIEEPREEPTFHVFASEWLEAKRIEGLSDRTYEDYKWALTHHLLPFFKDYRLSQITVRDIDTYKTGKAGEGVLSANTINKTITRLAQILELAVEYGHLPANPARGRRRRLKSTRPARGFVQPEQLPALLDATGGKTPLLEGRGRPLLAALAGAGLRIGEALALDRQDVNLARGTLTIRQSKTHAGVRVVDLTPALREELALWLDKCKYKAPTDPAFPTLKGKRDNRQNVRRRLLVPAIERANIKLAELKLEQIPNNVGLHGLRRTFASLRFAVGDDPVYTAAQLGHEDPNFTIRVYAQAVKRRDRLTAAEQKQYDRAVEWARMGTIEPIAASPAPGVESSPEEQPAVSSGFLRWAVLGSNQ